MTGANPTGGTGTTDGNGHAGFVYTGPNAGTTRSPPASTPTTAAACDPGEVTDTATKRWETRRRRRRLRLRRRFPVPKIGKSVVVGVVSGTIKVKGRNGKFRTLGANESIPVGSTVDATKGKVR